MNGRSLPVEHARVRWFFASSYLTIAATYLLFWLEPMQSGEAGPPWPFRHVGGEDAGKIALLFIALTLVNAWLLDGLLELRTRQQGRTRPVIRVVRFLAAGVPLVGIYVMPIWLCLLDHNPERALASLSSASSPSRRLLLYFSSRTQWLRLSIPFFSALLVGNLFFFGAGVAWVGATRSTLFGVSPLGLAAWMLHAVGLTAGLVFVAAQRSASVPLRVPRLIPWLLLLSWTLPGQWCVAGALILLVFDPQQRPSTLVQDSFGGRQPVKNVLMHLGRFDWWKVSHLQRSRWPSGRSPAQPIEAERRLAGLYRLKTFLLFPEVAFLTAGLVALTSHIRFAQAVVKAFCVTAFYGSLVVALTGGLLVALGAARSLRTTEEEEADSPSGQSRWSLMLTALAVAAGLCIGSPLGQRDMPHFANALWNIGLFGMLAAGALTVPFRFGKSKVHHRPLPLIAWLFVFAAIGYAGAWLGSSGASAPWVPPFAMTVLCLAPVAGLLMGVTSSRWLLHPFALRDLRTESLSLQSRLALAFLLATACAPGGGLAVPLWDSARRRLRVFEAPPPPVAPYPKPAPNSASLASLAREKRDYLIRHAITHQVENGSAETLFRQIEKHPFFAEQANCSGGFLRGSEDIEKHILPLALRTGDWERFLRYSSMAINLRRIGDDLAEPDLLPALARHGHRRMALDAAARVADPLQRALGRAALAASLDVDDADRKALLDFVRDDLALLSPIDDPEEAQGRAPSLFQIGVHLGPAIFPSLRQISSPGQGHEPTPGLLALSVAAGALQSNGGLDREAWEILQEIREEQVLAQFLPDLLGDAVATTEPDRLLDNLAMLSLGPEALWACRLSILANQARASLQEAVRSWKTLPANPPLPWSSALIERGAPLLAALTDLEVDAREREIESPVVRAALRVAILEHRPESLPDAAAREAIEWLPPGPERLHWTLRRAVVSPMPDETRKDEICAMGRWLFEQQHRAPFDDLRRYLELVARCLPEELQRRAEDVLLSLGGGAPLLFHLAQTGVSQAVLENLFEQAESYLSSLVGLPELEALRLWRELIHQLTGRLCLLRGDLNALDQAAEKLRDTDSLAARVAGSLAGAGAMDLAAEAAGRIQSGRLRLATRLRWLPETVTSSRDLEPEPLYKALASVGALEDEWLGLAALHDPGPPEILFQRHLDRIGDRDTQVIALYRLARQVLDLPETPREKGQLVLQMLGQALGAMQSDTRLVALTPWLPELVARLDPGRAIEEYREAFARLLGLHTVPWPARRDALERLLVQLATTLFGGVAETAPSTRSTCALFAEFEWLLADGIPGQEECSAADFLPVLNAALERLPPEIAAHLEQPLGSRLRFSDAESEEIRALCQASAAERGRALSSFRDAEPSPRMTQALAYLLLRGRPEHVLGLIDQYPGGSRQDDLCRRLVVHGWMTEQAAEDLVRRIGDADLTRETSLWIGPATRGTAEWLATFATLAAESKIDPSDPVWTPLLQDLWSSEPEPRRQALGESVLTALGKEAPQTAESTLRLWLHAHLSPLDRREQAGLCDNAFKAIRIALSLSPAAGAA